MKAQRPPYAISPPWDFYLFCFILFILLRDIFCCPSTLCLLREEEEEQKTSEWGRRTGGESKARGVYKILPAVPCLLTAAFGENLAFPPLTRREPAPSLPHGPCSLPTHAPAVTGYSWRCRVRAIT